MIGAVFSDDDDVWAWKIRHNGDLSSATTVAPAAARTPTGRFRVIRTMLNFDGTDDVVFRAENQRTGEVCRAVDLTRTESAYPVRGPERKVRRLRAAPQPGRAVPGDRALDRRRPSSSGRNVPRRPRRRPTRRSPRRAPINAGAGPVGRRTRVCRRAGAPAPREPGQLGGRSTASTAQVNDAAARACDRRRPDQRSGPRTAGCIYSSQLDVLLDSLAGPRRLELDDGAARDPRADGGVGLRDRRSGQPGGSRPRRATDGMVADLHPDANSPQRAKPLLFEAYFSLDRARASGRTRSSRSFRWITLGAAAAC